MTLAELQKLSRKPTAFERHEIKRRSPAKPLWLYRTVENDEDGDPLDFGALRAATRADAVRYVAERLKFLGLDLDAPSNVEFYVYPLEDEGHVGVIGAPAKGPCRLGPWSALTSPSETLRARSYPRR